MIPAGLVLDEPSLIRSGEVLRHLPVLVHDDARAWTGAVAEKRARHVRMMTTRLKPAVRAVLVVLGEPVVPTWLTPWDGLVDVWRRHDPPAAAALAEVLARLQEQPRDDDAAGAQILTLLAAISGEGASR